MLRLKPSRFTCSTPRLKKRRCGLCPSFFPTEWRKLCTAMMKLFSKRCFLGTRWTQWNIGCIVVSMLSGWRIILLQLKASSWTNLFPSVCMGMKFKVFATPKEEWFRPWLGAVIFQRACRHCPDTWLYVCFLTTTAHPGPSLTFGLFWLLGLQRCVIQALAMLGLHISSRIRQLKATSSGSWRNSVSTTSGRTKCVHGAECARAMLIYPWRLVISPKVQPTVEHGYLTSNSLHSVVRIQQLTMRCLAFLVAVWRGFCMTFVIRSF